MSAMSAGDPHEHSSNSRRTKSRSRALWVVFGASSFASMFGQACSDPFESCVERRACPPGGAAGALGHAGDGGEPITEGGANGATGGLANQAGAGAAGSSAGDTSPTAGRGPELAGGSGGVDSGEGGNATAGAGGAPPSEGGRAASSGGVASSGETIGGGGTLSSAGSAAGGLTATGGSVGTGGAAADACQYGETRLCSTLLPNGGGACANKRVGCPLAKTWEAAAELCVPSAPTCNADDDDCDGEPDNTAAECVGCAAGSYRTCALDSDPDCQSGLNICVQTSEGTHWSGCVEPASREGVMYPMGRSWCPSDTLLDTPCTAPIGTPGTMRSRCADKPTTCGYLYCAKSPT